MAYEIERKFLISSDRWRDQSHHRIEMKQAYLSNTDKVSLRVRVTDDAAFISAKSMTRDIRRHEFEYEIPLHDAEFMLMHMSQGSPIIKTRHLVFVDDHLWEIDEFHGDNEGLIVAEVELKHEDEEFTRPDWLGDEVSTDERYFNMNLVKYSYKNWTT